MGQSLGCLVYDVPLSERAIYTKLHSRIRRVGIPMTASCFLVPWGLRSEIIAILKEIESDRPNVVASNIIKFDDSEEKVLIAAAERGLQQIVKRTTELLTKRLVKAEADQVEIIERISSVKTTKNRKSSDAELEKMAGFARDKFELDSKRALASAEKALAESRKLSVLFALTSQLEFAFMGLEKLVKHQREVFNAKVDAKLVGANA